MSTLSAPISAMNAYSTSMQATATNVANVSTNNYNSLQSYNRTNSTNTGVEAYVQQRDSASISQRGQQLASESGNLESLTQNVANGEAPTHSLENTTDSVSSMESSYSLSSTTDQVANSPTPTHSLENTTASVSNNDVDFAREFSNTVTYQRGFEAQGVTVQTADDMLGTVVNMMA